MGCTQAIRARRSIRRFKSGASIPEALAFVGVPDEAPESRGFYEAGKVTWL